MKNRKLKLKLPHSKTNPSKVDPTRTGQLRLRFERHLTKLFNRLKVEINELIVGKDVFGLTPSNHDPFGLTKNTDWKFNSILDKLKQFGTWLKSTIQKIFLSPQEKKTAEEFVKEGFEKGMGRAFQDVKPAAGFDPSTLQPTPTPGIYLGSKEEFLRSSFGQPVAKEKVELILERTFSDLNGITEAMSTNIQRILADGMAQGKGAKVIAREINEQVDGIGKRRAMMLAQCEIVRSHAEGQLIALEQLGVESVGAVVEFSTAGDKRVCKRCAAMNHVVFKISEAKGKIPLHAMCRCCWKPANVGEKQKGQLRTKDEIDRAMKMAGVSGTVSQDRTPSFIPPTGNRFDPYVLSLDRWLVDNRQYVRDSVGRFAHTASMKASPLPSPGKVTFLKNLGGSTGAKLVQDEHGNKWVQKSTQGHLTRDHLENEVLADHLYRTLGVPVVHSGLVHENGVTYKYSKYLEGAKTLHEFEKTAPAPEVFGILTQLHQHFAKDALLANWDTVGLEKDNILIHDGIAYRVDNGGALKYRAQGSAKGDKFGAKVGELDSLKDRHLNPASASVFAPISKDTTHDQIAKLLERKHEVLDAALHSDGASAKSTHDILKERFQYLEKLHSDHLASKTPPHPVVQPKPKVGIETALNNGSAISGYVKNKFDEQGVKLTPMNLKKLEHLNPNGMVNGEIKHPFPGKKSEQIQALMKVFPEGTKLVYRSTTKEDLEGVSKGEVPRKIPKELLEAPKPEVVVGVLKKEDKKAELVSHHNATWEKLTPDEKYYVRDYTENGFTNLNEKMRKCPPAFECLDPKLKVFKAELESALDKAGKLPFALKVQRGIALNSKEEFDKFKSLVEKTKKKGLAYEMPSFTSTSVKQIWEWDDEKSHAIHFNIVAKSGLYVEPVTANPNENELLQSPKVRYRVTGHTLDHKGRLHVDLEELG